METFTDDTVVALGSFLSPHDMLNLSLTCQRFGDKHGIDKKRSAKADSSTRNVKQKTEAISLMEVAARTVLQDKGTDEEKNALPRRGDESWIGIYHEFLKLFHYPLQFDRLVGQLIEHVEGRNKKAVIVQADSENNSWSSRHSAAICTNIMRAGKHCVSFQVNDDALPMRTISISCGIMRPTTKDITTLTKCHPALDDLSRFSSKDYERLHNDNTDCCLLNTHIGNGMFRKRWKKWEDSELMAMDEEHRVQALEIHQCRPFQWEGMERTEESSYKIGFVLDLDEGTLDVYKNDRRLGTMMSGLVGEYCWVVSMPSLSLVTDVEVSVSINNHNTIEKSKVC